MRLNGLTLFSLYSIGVRISSYVTMIYVIQMIC